MNNHIIGATLMALPLLWLCFLFLNAWKRGQSKAETNLFLLVLMVLIFILGRTIAGTSFVLLLLQ